MSIPFLTFTCDCCDYSESSFVTFGQFLWNYDGQTFEFDRQLGLCQDCEGIVAMEDLPDADTMDRARKFHSTYTGPRLFWFQEGDKAKCLASQEGFGILERVMELNRPPVCLTCGGSDVQPLALPEVPDGSRRANMALTKLGVRHPGCGGQLQVEGSGGLRLRLSPVTYYFDIDGQAFTILRETLGPRKEKLPPLPRKTVKSPTRSCWRPDWGTFVRRAKEVHITFDDPELDVFSEVDVVEEWKGGFRIYGYAFSDVLYWGDLFEGEFDGDSSILFKRLLDRPEYCHFGGFLPPRGTPVPHAQDEWANKFPYLQRIIQAGGYWEYNALLGLYVVIPKNCVSDFPELKELVPIVLDEPPADVDQDGDPQPLGPKGRRSTQRTHSNASSIIVTKRATRPISDEKARKRRIAKLISKMPD